MIMVTEFIAIRNHFIAKMMRNIFRGREYACAASIRLNAKVYIRIIFVGHLEQFHLLMQTEVHKLAASIPAEMGIFVREL